MTVRVGINGFGRIGRNFFRAVRAEAWRGSPTSRSSLSTTSPTTRPWLACSCSTRSWAASTSRVSSDTAIKIGDQEVTAFAERDPSALKWSDVGADIVVESTGFFTDATKARAHVDAGAKKVIISAPASNEDITVVMGVNHEDYDPEQHTVISNASCTTNCLAPMAKAPQRRVRHRQGPDDDRARLHRRPEPAGQHPQGPAPRPRGRDQRGAHLDRRGQGDRPGAARAQGQARRLRPARPGPDRLGDRPQLRGRP